MTNTTMTRIDQASILAAQTRAAYATYERLNRSPYSQRTADREAASAALDAALEAERAFWASLTDSSP